MPQPLILLPEPRKLEFRSGTYRLEPGKRIVLEAAPAESLLAIAQRIQASLRQHADVEWGVAASAAGSPDEIGMRVRVDAGRVASPEGYILQVDADGIQVVAGSPAGAFYAACTLDQILQQSGARVPAVTISDRPDFAHRGVLLDVARDKVPTLQSLFDLVDRLASWKINQFQLYNEHAFTFRGHEVVWQHASPLTEQDILELDAFCRARFVELVPNQNSFGHMRRWLIHDRYRDLSECPNGCDTVWGHFDEPWSLNPLDPRSLDLLRDIFDQLIPHFSSNQFNVGCDETVDLGRGRSQVEAERRGVGVLYLEFLQKVHAEMRARGKVMQFWGDIINLHPELVPQLPREGLVALEWGYDADHPFDEHGARFARAGIPFYVCPGTSAWNSILGRTDNAVANISNAAENGLRHGAIGLLNTEWGDNGYWQYAPISELGYAYGAAASWCLETNRGIDLPAVMDRFAFRDKAGVVGSVATELGNAYQVLGLVPNGTAFHVTMQTPLVDVPSIPGLSPEGCRLALKAIDQALRPLARARMRRPDARLILQEFENAARLARHAARRGLLAFEKRPARAAKLRRELTADLSAIMRTHRRLWLARNRPGGLVDSLARMEAARQDYRGGKGRAPSRARAVLDSTDTVR